MQAILRSLKRKYCLKAQPANDGGDDVDAEKEDEILVLPPEKPLSACALDICTIINGSGGDPDSLFLFPQPQRELIWTRDGRNYVCQQKGWHFLSRRYVTTERTV